MGSFAGRRAVITGAAGAIGGATAARLAEGGADLFLLDLLDCGEVAEAARAKEVKVATARCDVRRGNEVQGVMAMAEAELGGIDILVNVAGVVSHGPNEALSEEDWDRVLDINLKGTWLCCQCVMPIMRRQGYGRIVNVGSLIGKNGGNPRPWLDRSEMNHAGNLAYGVSKAGVHALTWFLAKDLAADGVTVNAVAPGPIATGMTSSLPESLRQLIPVGRMGSAVEVADAICFLSGESAGFITGEVMDINGGMLVD